MAKTDPPVPVKDPPEVPPNDALSSKKAVRKAFEAHPHDMVYRSIFSDAEDAAGLLHIYLSLKFPDQLELFDLDRLQVWSLDLFVVGSLGEIYQDRLFTVPLRDTGDRVAFLVEHQSAPHPAMGARLNDYADLVPEAARRERRGPILPYIIPLVVYSNRDRQRWTAAVPAPLSAQAREFGAMMLPYLRGSMFPVLDLQRDIEDEDLRPYAQDPRYRVAALTLLLLKIAPKHENIDRALESWHDELLAAKNSPHGEGKIDWFLDYIRIVSSTPPERLKALAASLGKDVEDRYMTTLDMIRTETRTEDRAAMLMRVLNAKFGPVPKDIASDVAIADMDQLETWMTRTAMSATLDEVFPDRKK